MPYPDGPEWAECACAHFRASHPGDGPCQRTLPGDPEEEIPPWRCPCVKYRAKPAGPWRWHESTQTWHGVAS